MDGIHPPRGSVLDGYILSEQFATDLGVTERTLRDWHSKGLGPPRIKAGRLVLYSVAAVRAWLAVQEEADKTGRGR